MTNDELATALESYADHYITLGLAAPHLRGAARRLREHDAARICATEALRGVQATEAGGFSGDPVVDGIGALRAEVERLRSADITTRHLLADAVNGPYATVSHLVDEVERLSAAVRRVANERDDAQVACDRWRDAHEITAMRSDAMELAWQAEMGHANRWCAQARDAESIAALAMEVGLAECERLRTIADGRLSAFMSAAEVGEGLVRQRNEARARLARAESVVSAVRALLATAEPILMQEPVCSVDANCVEDARAALAAWDEEGRSDG